MPRFCPQLLMIATAVVALSICVPSNSQDMQIGQPKPTKQLVKVQAVADVGRIEPGQTFHLAFIFKIEPKWHIYWKSAGASGGPTEIEITVPDGFEIGETLFPRPSVFSSAEGDTYGYEDKAVLFVPVTAPMILPPGEVAFEADVYWLVCKNICLRGQSHEVIKVVTSPPGDIDDTVFDIDPDVLKTQKHLPRLLLTQESSELRFDGNVTHIRLASKGHQSAEFFPIGTPGVEFGEPRISIEGETVQIEVPTEINPNNALGETIRIRGLVGLGVRQTEPSYEFDLLVNDS